jgi:hypothetical protein
MNLIAVGYAALVDVVEVVHVQPSFWLALQTHGVTQNQGQHLSPFPCLDGEAAELWSDKKQVEGSNGSYLQSLFIIHRLRAVACPLVTPLSGSDLRGHTLATHSADGLRGHVASEHRVDGVEEAGLPGTHRPHQQHSGLGHTAELRLVLLDLLHQFLFTPAERRSRNIHFVKGLSLRRRRRR